MVKMLVAEECLQEHFTSLSKLKQFHIGLIIGQHGKDKDYVIHLAPTPVSVEDFSERDSQQSDAQNKEESTKVPDSIEKVVESNITQHARLLVRMLPGGLDIIGIYVVTSQADFNENSSQGRLRRISNNVHKAANCLLLDAFPIPMEKCIIHICTTTFKASCKIVSTTTGTNLNTCDLKFQRGVKWCQLSCTYHLNLNLWLPSDKRQTTAFKSIQEILKPWAQNISKSVVLVNCKVIADDEFLDPVDEKGTKRKGGVRGGLDLCPPKVFMSQILSPSDGGSEVSGELSRTTGSVEVVGDLCGRAFVHSKANGTETKSAILIDLIRSVNARWEMHCDSLVEEPQMGSGIMVHEPPRRVFLEGGNLPVSLCDYLFPGDTVLDACESVKELVGIVIHEENVDDAVEEPANISQVMPQRNLSESEIKISSVDTSQKSSLVQILLFVFVAVVGVFISYITLTAHK